MRILLNYPAFYSIKNALANTGIQSTFASHSLIKLIIFYGIRRNSFR